jgi:hypothetical protein
MWEIIRQGLPARRAIFRFIENVLAEERFDPAAVNRYCRE